MVKGKSGMIYVDGVGPAAEGTRFTLGTVHEVGGGTDGAKPVSPLNVPSRGPVGEWLDALEVGDAGVAGGRVRADAPVSKAFRFWEAEQAQDPDRILALEAIADAARVVQGEAVSVYWRYRGEGKRDTVGRRAWHALADALDAYDEVRSGHSD